MEKQELTNAQALDWVYMSWRKLGEQVKGKEYAIRRRSYERMMWELKELMPEEEFYEIANKYVKR